MLFNIVSIHIFHENIIKIWMQQSSQKMLHKLNKYCVTCTKQNKDGCTHVHISTGQQQHVKDSLTNRSTVNNPVSPEEAAKDSIGNEVRLSQSLPCGSDGLFL